MATFGGQHVALPRRKGPFHYVDLCPPQGAGISIPKRTN